MRISVLCTAALAVAALACGTAFAAAHVSAPSKAHVGDSVSASASGLKTGRYALTLVSDSRPGLHAACVARIAGPHRTSGGAVELEGRIPRRLTCWENDSVRLGRVKVTPGAYHLIVAVPDGPSGFNASFSFLRRALRIVG
jgi:hypothetical protein